MDLKRTVCELSVLLDPKPGERPKPLGRRCGDEAVVLVKSASYTRDCFVPVCEGHYHHVVEHDRDALRKSLDHTVAVLDEAGDLIKIPYRVFPRRTLRA